MPRQVLPWSGDGKQKTYKLAPCRVKHLRLMVPWTTKPPFLYIMATTTSNPVKTPTTVNQLFKLHKKQSKSVRSKNNRREREARRLLAWETSAEVADMRLIGERMAEEESEFISTCDLSSEISTPLPAAWLRNRLRFQEWQRRDEEESVREVERAKAFTAAYKRGVNKCFGAVRRYFLRNKVSGADNATAAAVLDEVDNSVGEPGDDLVEEEVEVRGKKESRLRPRHRNDLWWVKYAVVTRSEHPLLTDTPAQRRTVHRYALDLMKADNVTRVDAARVIYKVVEAAYVPTSVEVEVARFKESRPVRQRLWDASAPYWSYWWGVRRRASGTD